MRDAHKEMSARAHRKKLERDRQYSFRKVAIHRRLKLQEGRRVTETAEIPGTRTATRAGYIDRPSRSPRMRFAP